MRRVVTPVVVLCLAFLAMTPVAANAAESCANAGYRQGLGANLPECRAWEQVSPAAKNGANVPTQSATAASPSGDDVLFKAPNVLGGATALPYEALFAGTRGTDWSVFGTDPPLDSGPYLTQVGSLGARSDLTKVLVVTQRKLTPQATEGDSNLYVRDTRDRSYAFVASAPGGRVYRQFINTGGLDSYYGANADFSHIVFSSRYNLAPGGVDNFDGATIYEAVNGTLRLVSKRPDGSTLLFGRNESVTPQPERNLVSRDGRRITWVGRGDDGLGSPLFQRVNGSSTVAISVSEQGGGDPNAPASAASPWASADGTRVIFSGTGGLAADSPADDSGRLYRWDAGAPAGRHLTDLLHGVVSDSIATGIDSVQDVSPDGRYVWFYSKRVLGAGGVDGIQNLYLLDTSGSRSVTTVATFDFDGENSFGAQLHFSPDGTKVAIRAFSRLTGYDNTNPACSDPNTGVSGTCAEIFSYDALRPGTAPTCLSCGQPGEQALNNAEAGLLRSNFGGIPAHPALDDGRVFFDTAQPLVPEDLNTVADVYEYLPGQGVRLITSGQGSQPAAFADAATSGSGVFFTTADPLVPQDADTLSDLYDARVGGGIASQQIAPGSVVGCEGSDCQGQLPPAGLRPVPGPPAAAHKRAAAFVVGHPSSAARRRAASTGRLAIPVRVGAAGTVAGRAKARIGRRTSTVGSASQRRKSAGRFSLEMQLSRAARAALRRAGSLKVAVTVSYSGASKPKTLSVTLTVPRARSSAKGGHR